MPADCLDFLGDVAGAAPLGALEGHVFEEMRDAVDFRRFVPRPDIDPDAERHGINGVDPVGDDAQSIRECRQPRLHAAP